MGLHFCSSDFTHNPCNATLMESLYLSQLKFHLHALILALSIINPKKVSCRKKQGLRPEKERPVLDIFYSTCRPPRKNTEYSKLPFGAAAAPVKTQPAQGHSTSLWVHCLPVGFWGEAEAGSPATTLLTWPHPSPPRAGKKLGAPDNEQAWKGHSTSTCRNSRRLLNGHVLKCLDSF